MATKPEAWQEQGPVSSLDEWVNESWVQGEEGTLITHGSPLQDKKAPKAEPEEDIDVLEPEAQVTAQRENQTIDAAKMKNQESKKKSRGTRRETQEIVTDLEQVCKKLSGALLTQEEPEELVDLYEETFPPPPSNSALSAAEYSEKEAFSSLEGEVAEWISDVEFISNAADDLTSLDSQNSQEMPQLIEPVDQEEMTGDTVTAEANVAQLNFFADGISTSNTDNNRSQPAHHSGSDSNNSGGVNTMSSPPFADESEEEEELIDIMSCQQQMKTLNISSKVSQPSFSVSDLTQDSVLHATPSVEQQEELLLQSQPELAPREENQEAAQQVLGLGSPPLSTVAMELSNQGGAAPRGSGCVVSLSKMLSRAGERTEGEHQQTGVEQGQKESRLERNKPAGQQHNRGLLYSQTVKIQALKQEKYSCGVSLKHSAHSRMEYDSCDDSQSDSGVSADFSPCSTMDGTNTTITTGTPATVSKETPIDKEIRRAIEREQSLRRSRGLPNPPTSPEYVEIPLRKSVLCQSLTKSEKHQHKDRELAGKKMKHEIHTETQREQDLVKLGKIPGFYDKGTVRQIKEKKDLFEAFQTPNDPSFTPRYKAQTWSSASEVSTLENQEDFSLQVSTTRNSYVERRRSLELLSPTQGQNAAKGVVLTDSSPRGPGFSEGTGCQVIILESNLSIPAQKRYHIKPEAEASTHVISSSGMGGHDGRTAREKETEEEKEVAPTENPFFKLRSSTNLVKVKQDIQEAQEREKELQKQRISLYGDSGNTDGGGGGGGGRPISMEGKNPMLSSSLNGLAVPDLLGSSSRGGTGSSAARQSVGKPCVWPPAQPEEEKINRPEVPQSPRTPRQKTPLVQRWESGLVNGHITEDD